MVFGLLVDGLKSGKLTQEDLVRLERDLEILDRCLPRYAVYNLGNLEHYGQVILGGREADFFSNSTHRFRPSDFGLVGVLSPRLVLLASFHQQDEWAAR